MRLFLLSLNRRTAIFTFCYCAFCHFICTAASSLQLTVTHPIQKFPNIQMYTIRSCLNRLFAVLSMDTFTKFYSSIICSLFFTPSGYLLYLIPSISNHFYFYPFVHSFILHNIFTSDKFYHIT